MADVLRVVDRLEELANEPAVATASGGHRPWRVSRRRTNESLGTLADRFRLESRVRDSPIGREADAPNGLGCLPTQGPLAGNPGPEHRRQMIKIRIFAAVSLIGAWGCAVVSGPATGPGQGVLDAAFDPNRSFEGELVANSDEALILTARASARDDYAPAYSLAIAYRCVATEKVGERRCGYTARMLRTGPTIEEGFDRSLKLAAQARKAETASEMRSRLDEAELQWLEADVGACPKGIFAMDSVRVADWGPDIHYAIQAVEDREIIMHPASIHVRMSGTYTTSTYEGWVLAGGVPAAVRQLTGTLESCWKPATSPPPWKRG